MSIGAQLVVGWAILLLGSLWAGWFAAAYLRP